MNWQFMGSVRAVLWIFYFELVLTLGMLIFIILLFITFFFYSAWYISSVILISYSSLEPFNENLLLNSIFFHIAAVHIRRYLQPGLLSARCSYPEQLAPHFLAKSEYNYFIFNIGRDQIILQPSY